MSPAVCATGVASAALRRSEVLPAALSRPTLPIWAVPARIRLLAGEGCYLPSNLFGGFSREGTSVGWGCGGTGARWAGTGMGVGALGWSCLLPWCRDPPGAAARPLPGVHGHPGAAARHVGQQPGSRPRWLRRSPVAQGGVFLPSQAAGSQPGNGASPKGFHPVLAPLPWPVGSLGGCRAVFYAVI